MKYLYYTGAANTISITERFWRILLNSIISKARKGVQESVEQYESILCQCKTNKIEFPKEIHQNEIHKTSIRPVVTYSSENWTLTAKDENNPRIFERQILRKIFGPVNIDHIWRIRNNTEIAKLIEGAGIVRYITAQRIKCLGHIRRMDQGRPNGSHSIGNGWELEQ
jgi:hypothetical protein